MASAAISGEQSPAMASGTAMTLYHEAIEKFSRMRRRALRAVLDNDTAAGVLGIPVTKIKIESFFAGALFAGVAGAILAYFLQFVTVSIFNYG